jgi:hypothetical protein
MSIFGGRTQAQSGPSAADLARVVPSGSDEAMEEAGITARASDTVLRGRFASVWPRSFEIPADPSGRVGAVHDAMVAQEREETADIARRADRIAGLPSAEMSRSFGVEALPVDPVARGQAAIEMAMRDVEGFESPRVAAERALSKARAVREALSLDRADAERFKDVSPLARLTWKHVPDMAARFGVPIGPREGYSPGDAEHGDTGLAIHNSGADSRAASKVRNGFSQSVNREIDALIGPQGSGGIIDRVIEEAAQRERRLSHQSTPARRPARDMSAAAFLSGMISR